MLSLIKYESLFPLPCRRDERLVALVLNSSLNSADRHEGASVPRAGPGELLAPVPKRGRVHPRVSRGPAE